MKKLSITLSACSILFACFCSHAEERKTETLVDVKSIVLDRNIEFSPDEKILQQQEELACQSNSCDEVFMANLNTVIEQSEWKLSKFYLWRANAYFEQGEYEYAEANYRRILNYSKHGYIEYRIGQCLYEQVKYHEALEMFKKASAVPESKLNPDTHFIYPYHEGLTLIQLKKLDEAKALFDQLKIDFPDRDLSKVYLWFPEEK